MTSNRPTAAPHVWPYPGHRTMADVMAAEDTRRSDDLVSLMAADRARHDALERRPLSSVGGR